MGCKEKGCPKGFICNPASNRCVIASGAVGKRLLTGGTTSNTKKKSRNSKKKSPTRRQTPTLRSNVMPARLPVPWANVRLSSRCEMQRVDPRAEDRAALIEEIEKHARIQAMRVRSIIGDGNCMFRAVVQGIALAETGDKWPRHLEESYGMQLRESVGDYLAMCAMQMPRGMDFLEEFYSATNNNANRPRNVPSLLANIRNTWVPRPGRPTRWAQFPEVMAASIIIGRPIIVYSEHETAGVFLAMVCAPIDVSNHLDPRSFVRIMYNGNDHYEVIQTVFSGRVSHSSWS